MFHSKCLLWSCLLGALVACGSGENRGSESAGDGPTPATSASRPSGSGACGLLLQSEVDELFQTSIGAGQHEALGEGVELCSWPDSENAALLLQVSSAQGEVEDAVDLGPGYRVVELEGLSGPAAAAIQEADDDSGQIVAVVAMSLGDKTLTISPIGLGLVEGETRFARLKAILEAAAGRL